MFVRSCAPLLVAVMLAGCSQKEPAQTDLPPETAAQIESQVIPAPNAQPGAPAAERLVGAVHPEMTEKLLQFEKAFNRMPENFYEFSGRMMDSVPAAPPGMRYDIDPVDKAVKLVRKTE
jgi:hypothetical protein